jgi:hypothetical protein
LLEHDSGALEFNRRSLIDALGQDALIDAAGVVGSFQRMNLVADATGIPLDAPVNALSADIQDELELRDFESAAMSSKPNAFLAKGARWLRPLAFRILGKSASRRR